MRRLAVAAAVLAVLSGAWALRPAADPVAGEWLRVERGALAVGVDVTGTLEAGESASLGPPQVPRMWDFRISFLAPEGKDVATGEPVLRFDASELERRLLERRAEVEEAAKELEKRRTELAQRRDELALAFAEAGVRRRRFAGEVAVPEELVAAAELERAAIDLALAGREEAHLRERLEFERRRNEAELAALSERRDRAAARVREIEEQIARMTVRAPRAGTVVHVSRRGREKPRVGDTVWQGHTLVEIPDLGRMVARGEVEEADAGRVAPGQAAALSLDALPGVEVEGEVVSVANSVARRDRRSPLKVVEVEIRLGTEVVEPRLGRRGGGRVEVLAEGDRVRAPGRGEG